MKKLGIVMMASLLLVLGACGKKNSDDEEIKNNNTKEELKANNVYEVPLNPTDYQYDLYNELSKSLTSEKEVIAKLVVQNFSADFFTLKNKGSAEAIGGLTYLPEGNREEFKVFAMNYVYANYQTITDKYGKDNLPEVTKVVVDSIVSTVEPFTIIMEGEEEEEAQEFTENYEGYSINVTISYADTKVSEKDLKTTATFVIIEINNRLEIIRMS